MSRAILQLQFGPLAQRKWLVEPNATLSVGRSDWAAAVVPHDAKLEQVHFEIARERDRWWLRPLGERPTSLNGLPLRAATRLAHGDWIAAGDSHFLCFFDEARAPAEAVAGPSEDALAALQQRMGSLFAVLDAARDDRVLELVNGAIDPQVSLYRGIHGQALHRVAPHLVELAPGSPLLTRLVREGWGKRWGIFLSSSAPLEELRRHLRRFLMVEEEVSGERLYFRFYDPAVLRMFLPVATARQLGQWWQEIDAVLLEGEDLALAVFSPAPEAG